MTITEWLEEIQDAKKREKTFFDDGEEIIDLYEGEKTQPFNILYSNTETVASGWSPERKILYRCV